MIKCIVSVLFFFILNSLAVVVAANPAPYSGSNTVHRFQGQRQDIARGLRLFRQGQTEKAKIFFLNTLAKNKNSLIAKEMLAIISLQQKDITAAEKYARQSLKQNRQSAKAHLVLAGTFRQKGNILAMRDHLRKAKRYASKKEIENLRTYLKQLNLEFDKNLQRLKLDKNDLIQQVKIDGTKPFVAFFPFQFNLKENKDSGLSQTVSEMLTTAFIQSGIFQVLERSQLNKILEEQALGLSGAIDEGTAVDVGQLLGVDAIVVGNVAMFENTIELDARVVDAVSGRAYIAANASAKDEKSLRNAVNELARKLSSAAERIPTKRQEKTDPQSLQESR